MSSQATTRRHFKLKKSPAEMIQTPLTNLMKPILKWVGGKTQIIDDVLSFFPKTINNYHEPFLGGGSVLLALLSQIRDGKATVTGTIYASDLNPYLIALYTNIQSNVDNLILEAKALIEEYEKITGTEVKRKPVNEEEARGSQESFYYWIRSKFNAFGFEEKKSARGSAMFLFINKTCFRGVYREGPTGINVPFGHYKNPGIMDEDHVRAVSALIRNVVFTCQPFVASVAKATVANATAGDFVYLDPPYAPKDVNSFVAYTKEGFDIDEHKSLFKEIHALSAKGIKLVMSNAEVKLVTDAFPEPTYKTKIISCRRAINSKDPADKTNEVLIIN
jgi:DNA adenine methylase